MKKLVNTFIKTTLKRKKMYRRKTQCSMSAFIKHKKCHVIRKKIQSGWNPPSTHLRNGANCSFFGVFFYYFLKMDKIWKTLLAWSSKIKMLTIFFFFFSHIFTLFTYINFSYIWINFPTLFISRNDWLKT